jgi:hypothetical protein
VVVVIVFVFVGMVMMAVTGEGVCATHTPRSEAVNTGRRSEFIANSPLPGSAVVCQRYSAMMPVTSSLLLLSSLLLVGCRTCACVVLKGQTFFCVWFAFAFVVERHLLVSAAK